MGMLEEEGTGGAVAGSSSVKRSWRPYEMIRSRMSMSGKEGGGGREGRNLDLGDGAGDGTFSDVEGDADPVRRR